MGSASKQSLEQLRPASRLELAIEDVEREIVRAKVGAIEPDDLRRIKRRLRNNGKLKQLQP